MGTGSDLPVACSAFHSPDGALHFSDGCPCEPGLGGFKSYFEPKYGKKFSYFTNGVDEVFIEAGKAIQPTNNDPPVLLYAGNFGGGPGGSMMLSFPILPSRLEIE